MLITHANHWHEPVHILIFAYKDIILCYQLFMNYLQIKEDTGLMIWQHIATSNIFLKTKWVALY